MTASSRLISRLAYLCSLDPDVRIPRQLIPYIPGGDWINEMIIYGNGASRADPKLVSGILEEGASLGPGNSSEIIPIIQRLVDDNLRDDHRLSIERRLKLYRILEGLQSTMAEQTVEIDLHDPGEITEIPKFDTGFQPLDATMSSLYQGIFMFMGAPGSGKTSLLIAMMETLRKSEWPGSLFMLENEIPAPMMKGRFADVFRRTKFNKGDKLVCGPWSASHILHWVKENPDPERIIFFDSPDVTIGSDGNFGSKKLFQEAEYLTMIELKNLCRAIIVTSWPKGSTKQIESFHDFSDAIEKVRYADGIVGINPMSNGRLQLKCLKNRFGPNDGDLIFAFDYQHLTWEPGSIEVEAEFWSALTEESEAEGQPQPASNGRA